MISLQYGSRLSSNALVQMRHPVALWPIGRQLPLKRSVLLRSYRQSLSRSGSSFNFPSSKKYPSDVQAPVKGQKIVENGKDNRETYTFSQSMTPDREGADLYPLGNLGEEAHEEEVEVSPFGSVSERDDADVRPYSSHGHPKSNGEDTDYNQLFAREDADSYPFFTHDHRTHKREDGDFNPFSGRDHQASDRGREGEDFIPFASVNHRASGREDRDFNPFSPTYEREDAYFDPLSSRNNRVSEQEGREFDPFDHRASKREGRSLNFFSYPDRGIDEREYTEFEPFADRNHRSSKMEDEDFDSYASTNYPSSGRENGDVDRLYRKTYKREEEEDEGLLSSFDEGTSKRERLSFNGSSNLGQPEYDEEYERLEELVEEEMHGQKVVNSHLYRRGEELSSKLTKENDSLSELMGTASTASELLDVYFTRSAEFKPLHLAMLAFSLRSRVDQDGRQLDGAALVALNDLYKDIIENATGKLIGVIGSICDVLLQSCTLGQASEKMVSQVVDRFASRVKELEPVELTFLMDAAASARVKSYSFWQTAATHHFMNEDKLDLSLWLRGFMALSRTEDHHLLAKTTVKRFLDKVAVRVGKLEDHDVVNLLSVMKQLEYSPGELVESVTDQLEERCRRDSETFIVGPYLLSSCDVRLRPSLLEKYAMEAAEFVSSFHGSYMRMMLRTFISQQYSNTALVGAVSDQLMIRVDYMSPSFWSMIISFFVLFDSGNKMAIECAVSGLLGCAPERIFVADLTTVAEDLARVKYNHTDAVEIVRWCCTAVEHHLGRSWHHVDILRKLIKAANNLLSLRQLDRQFLASFCNAIPSKLKTAECDVLPMFMEVLTNNGTTSTAIWFRMHKLFTARARHMPPDVLAEGLFLLNKSSVPMKALRRAATDRLQMDALMALSSSNLVKVATVMMRNLDEPKKDEGWNQWELPGDWLRTLVFVMRRRLPGLTTTAQSEAIALLESVKCIQEYISDFTTEALAQLNQLDNSALIELLRTLSSSEDTASLREVIFKISSHMETLSEKDFELVSNYLWACKDLKFVQGFVTDVNRHLIETIAQYENLVPLAAVARNFKQEFSLDDLADAVLAEALRRISELELNSAVLVLTLLTQAAVPASSLTTSMCKRITAQPDLLALLSSHSVGYLLRMVQVYNCVDQLPKVELMREVVRSLPELSADAVSYIASRLPALGMATDCVISEIVPSLCRGLESPPDEPQSGIDRRKTSDIIHRTCIFLSACRVTNKQLLDHVGDAAAQSLGQLSSSVIRDLCVTFFHVRHDHPGLFKALSDHVDSLSGDSEIQVSLAVLLSLCLAVHMRRDDRLVQIIRSSGAVSGVLKSSFIKAANVSVLNAWEESCGHGAVCRNEDLELIRQRQPPVRTQEENLPALIRDCVGQENLVHPSVFIEDLNLSVIGLLALDPDQKPLAFTDTSAARIGSVSWPPDTVHRCLCLCVSPSHLLADKSTVTGGLHLKAQILRQQGFRVWQIFQSDFDERLGGSLSSSRLSYQSFLSRSAENCLKQAC